MKLKQKIKEYFNEAVDVTPSMGIIPGSFDTGVSAQEIRDIVDAGVKAKKK